MAEKRAGPAVTLAEVRAAAARIAGTAVRTPLLSSPFLDERLGGRVFLKCESLQRTGSFKFRGAYNAIASLDEAARAGGVVAVSSGNHAQGIAEAARLFGVAATIIMPADAPTIKRARTERSGARVVTYDRASEDRDAVAAAYLAEHGGVLVHPYNDVAVIAGQGTVGLEIAEQAAAGGIVLDAVLVPVSGGGLSAGIAVAVKALNPATNVYGVEPEDFDDYRRSLAAGEMVANSRSAGSICDALLAPRPGAIGFALNRDNLAGVVTVSDEAVLAAVAFAFEELKLVVEPGGAVALAAVLGKAYPPAGKAIAIVLSGGNIDPPVLLKALLR